MSLILPRARDRPHFYIIVTAHLYLLILGYSHFHELSRLVKSLSEDYNLVIVSINKLIFGCLFVGSLLVPAFVSYGC